MSAVKFLILTLCRTLFSCAPHTPRIQQSTAVTAAAASQLTEVSVSLGTSSSDQTVEARLPPISQYGAAPQAYASSSGIPVPSITTFGLHLFFAHEYSVSRKYLISGRCFCCDHILSKESIYSHSYTEVLSLFAIFITVPLRNSEASASAAESSVHAVSHTAAHHALRNLRDLLTVDDDSTAVELGFTVIIK